jgi:acyl-coenzyme A synthetase/AMP-(fatty) acid ligase
MSMLQFNRRSLRDLTGAGASPPTRFLADDRTKLALCQLDGLTSIDHGLALFRGRSVMIRTERQLSAVLAALELDGIAGRILLGTPDLAAAHLPAVFADGAVDILISDNAAMRAEATALGVTAIACGTLKAAATPEEDSPRDTDWVLFTSGTTGRPKMVQHSLSSLAGALQDGTPAAHDKIWSTFYDIRRYGGLQILLRALIGGGSMVLSEATEEAAQFLARAGQAGVTHISGTPSHWRRTLMNPAATALAPRYIRLSGEIADQSILDSLGHRYPAAEVAHAFASTEGGVAFDVRDGLAGFPASLIGTSPAGVECRVEDGSLRLRSSRVARRYLGDGMRPIQDPQGFVDTGDMIALKNGRYHFVGRREGVINVGGLKVHPEKVEAVINRHPRVQMSRVKARANPITGAIVVADIVLTAQSGDAAGLFHEIRLEILAECRQWLAPHEIPAKLSEARHLPISASGKLARLDA